MKEEIKEVVKKAYGKIALEDESCCGKSFTTVYSEEDLREIPKEALMGLGCGNPVLHAKLSEGDIVLDLGSGAGADVFLAAKKVGEKGKAIGIDMTPEMVERARMIGEREGIKNVEFILGEIENLPLEENSIDVVVSNCVINLSPEKEKVFSEIYRVLKPGGRVMISDIALKKKLPKEISESIEAYVSCVAGAVLASEYKEIVEKSGLKNVKVWMKESFCGLKEEISNYIVSIYLEARK